VLGHADASNEQTNVNKSETDIEQENEAKQNSYSGYGQSQAGEQDAEQSNDADVSHEQSNEQEGLNTPVALGILGKAEAENEQSNVSISKTWIEQSNEAEQEQERTYAGKKPCSSPCQPKTTYVHRVPCSAKCEPERAYGRESSSGAGQSVRQENDADVSHEQSNEQEGLNTPVALGILGKAEAENEQSNVSISKTWIEQSNEAEQEQDLIDMCKGLIHR
jgi:hypothetical protein